MYRKKKGCTCRTAPADKRDYYALLCPAHSAEASEKMLRESEARLEESRKTLERSREHLRKTNKMADAILEGVARKLEAHNERELKAQLKTCSTCPFADRCPDAIQKAKGHYCPRIHKLIPKDLRTGDTTTRKAATFRRASYDALCHLTSTKAWEERNN
ncbi:hypothetical protein [Flaviaesturariibacter amylovorans]|uniref:Uncharacterized protein n=1 Tax=Flaviaesturariibacter amylovorans TaxID=1084520 RepID=A0ABP8GPG0_9BACT